MRNEDSNGPDKPGRINRYERGLGGKLRNKDSNGPDKPGRINRHESGCIFFQRKGLGREVAELE